MTNEIVTQADIPSHKLTVKTEDGRFKVFYVTEKQAERLKAGINGADKFICLSKDVDKDAPSFYPKYGACLERIPKDERDRMQQKYDHTIVKHKEETQEKAKLFDSAKVDVWILANPEAWETSKKAAYEKLCKTAMFLAASDVVQSVFVRMEARRSVHDQIVKPNTDENKKESV